jgi:glycosyltransferase involved in cell wall biosynthesis
MTEVTVVIPTRNRWSTLASRSLRSALAQEGVDLEVVVVDDGSDHDMRGDLAVLRDHRVSVVRHETSRGVAAARNSGISRAAGLWLAFLDDDDVWAPVKLRRQLDALSAPGAVLAHASVAVVDEGWRVVHVSAAGPVDRKALLVRNVIPAGSSNVVARTDLVRGLGGFDERLTYVADWDLWLRLAAEGSVCTCPEVLVAYVRQGNGMAFAGRVAVSELRYFAAKHPDLEADPARFLSWVATEDRLAGRRRAAAATYSRSAVAFRRPRQLLHAVGALLDVNATGSLRAPERWSPPVGDGDVVSLDWLDAYR